MHTIARAIDAVGTEGLRRLQARNLYVVDGDVFDALRQALEEAGLAIVHPDKLEMLEELYSRVKQRTDIDWDEDTDALLRQLRRMEAVERG